MTAYPIARSMTPIEGGVNGHHRAADWSRPAGTAGGNQPQEPDRWPAREDGRRRQEGAGVRMAAAVSAFGYPHDYGQGREEMGDKPQAARNAARRDRRLGFREQRALGVSGNRDLFLNTINWLAQQENLIAIRPRDPEDRRIHAHGRPGAADLLPDQC